MAWTSDMVSRSKVEGVKPDRKHRKDVIEKATIEKEFAETCVYIILCSCGFKQDVDGITWKAHHYFQCSGCQKYISFKTLRVRPEPLNNGL